MGPLVASIAAFVLMLLGAFVAVQLRRVLSDHHFTEDAKDIVRLSASLMATLAALVLSLLISSANNAYDAQRRELREIVANAVLLDSLLEEYGPQTRQQREKLREFADQLANSIWRQPGQPLTNERGFVSGDQAVRFRQSLRALPAADDRQRELRAQALQMSLASAQVRYVLYESHRNDFPVPFLVILIGWLAALFMSFCLFTPPNRIAIAALVILALSTSSALFMLLELSNPFDGLLALPRSTIAGALAPLPPA